MRYWWGRTRRKTSGCCFRDGIEIGICLDARRTCACSVKLDASLSAVGSKLNPIGCQIRRCRVSAIDHFFGGDVDRGQHKALRINTQREFMSPIGRPTRFVDGGGAVDELFS